MLGAKRTLSCLLAAAFLCAGVGAAAAAQVYPPPTPGESPKPKKPRCAITGAFKRTEDGYEFREKQRFAPGDRMIVKGERGCAKPRKPVRVSLGRNRPANEIGSSKSGRYGSYSVSTFIPRQTTSGSHRVFVETSGQTYKATIRITSSSTGSKSGFSATAPPMIATWAMLATLVAAFAVVTRRRRRPLAAVDVPAPEVPMIDTWDFVPVLPGRRPRPAATRSTKKPAGKPSSARRKTKPTAKPAPKTHEVTASGAEAKTGKAKARPSASRKPKSGAKSVVKPALKTQGPEAARPKAPRASKPSADKAKPKQPDTGAPDGDRG